MRLDVEPRVYSTLDDLIDSYVYGSAIVVGYFLAYVYGGSDFPRILESSRSLGIALQLTNFLRDVGEDQRRGRVYLPLDMLHAEGLSTVDVDDRDQLESLNRVLRRVSAIAEDHYAASERDLDAFAPDCVTAIRACIDVYRQLNLRIGRSMEGVRHRESVPMVTKFQVLPPSKYWRLPLAWLGAL
jgi:phytoene synthase